MAVIVDIDDIGINWLVKRVHCLSEADADDPREIGVAISRMIQTHRATK